MTREELRRELDANGVHADAYDFDKTQKDEVYCLEEHPAGWTVYYRERGLRRDERTFDSEHDAGAFSVTQFSGTLPLGCPGDGSSLGSAAARAPAAVGKIGLPADNFRPGVPLE